MQDLTFVALSLAESGLTPCGEHIISSRMKTVSLTIDEHLLEQIDAVAQARHQKRSALFCEAVRHWLKQRRLKTLVKRNQKGYRQHPVQPDEFASLIRAQRRRAVNRGEIWNFRFDSPDKRGTVLSPRDS